MYLYDFSPCAAGQVGIELGASWYEPERENENWISETLEKAFMYDVDVIAEPLLGTGNNGSIGKTCVHLKSHDMFTKDTLV